MKPPPRKVTLLYLGGRFQENKLIKLSLSRFADRLNGLRGQVAFEFEVPEYGIDMARDLDNPGSDELGRPDYRDKMYTITPLLNRLESDWAPAQQGNDDLVIGVLRSPLTHEEKYEDDSNSLGQDYYSRSDSNRCAVVTTSRAMLANVPKGKTIEQYLAYLIAAELVNVISKSDRMHPGDDPCLFNDCEDRALLEECMDSGDLCPRCAREIQSWGLSEDEQASIRAILHWCKEDSPLHTAKEVLSHPLKSVTIAGAGPFVKLLVGIATSANTPNGWLAGIAREIVGAGSWDLLAPFVVFFILFFELRLENRHNHG